MHFQVFLGEDTFQSIPATQVSEICHLCIFKVEFTQRTLRNVQKDIDGSSASSPYSPIGSQQLSLSESSSVLKNSSGSNIEKDQAEFYDTAATRFKASEDLQSLNKEVSSEQKYLPVNPWFLVPKCNLRQII